MRELSVSSVRDWALRLVASVLYTLESIASGSSASMASSTAVFIWLRYTCRSHRSPEADMVSDRSWICPCSERTFSLYLLSVARRFSKCSVPAELSDRSSSFWTLCADKTASRSSPCSEEAA